MASLNEIILKGETPPVIVIGVMLISLMSYQFVMNKEDKDKQILARSELKKELKLMIEKNELKIANYIVKHEVNYTTYRKEQRGKDKEQDLLIRAVERHVDQVDNNGSRKWNTAPRK